mmetsp:Transcript_69801/g.130392  ORF Transcript_69801/g.130392 Transcript_69801/m.130392 type:complete len:309 (-) Transcript_69801:488-1414(-)
MASEHPLASNAPYYCLPAILAYFFLGRRPSLHPPLPILSCLPVPLQSSSPLGARQPVDGSGPSHHGALGAVTVPAAEPGLAVVGVLVLMAVQAEPMVVLEWMVVLVELTEKRLHPHCWMHHLLPIWVRLAQCETDCLCPFAFLLLAWAPLAASELNSCCVLVHVQAPTSVAMEAKPEYCLSPSTHPLRATHSPASAMHCVFLLALSAAVEEVLVPHWVHTPRQVRQAGSRHEFGLVQCLWSVRHSQLGPNRCSRIGYRVVASNTIAGHLPATRTFALPAVCHEVACTARSLVSVLSHRGQTACFALEG